MTSKGIFDYDIGSIDEIIAYRDSKEARLLLSLADYYRENKMTDKLTIIESWLNDLVLFELTSI